MNIRDWADKWGISQTALDELFFVLGCPVPTDQTHGAGPEALAQQQVRKAASENGSRLWRNNVGAVTTEDGRFLRFGLCNESKQMNESIKSSDLIGIRPVTITALHVGKIIGQFVAREVKKQNWKYKGTKREQAQLKFINLVLSMGGDAAFTRGEWI